MDAAATIVGYQLGRLINVSEVAVVYEAIATATNDPVVIKTLRAVLPQREHIAEVRREHRLLERLSTIPGIVRARGLEERENGNVVLVMESVGTSISDLLESGRQLDIAEVLRIAIPLSRTLGEIHDLDIVHKDVVPANIVVSPGLDRIALVDFSLASELSSERQASSLSSRFEGTFPYMSPEQTGRMNREVDHRSDLYTLGVTLFEMLTSALPFTAEHPLDWAHCHIAQTPPRVIERNPKVPRILGEIVDRLLSKSPEDRYQSTVGLTADLERCQAMLSEDGLIVEFELGREDVSRRFQIPSRLFGRDSELRAVRDAFDLASGGGTELVMVTGDSGVGKTALVNELSSDVVRSGGYLVQGKFDQFHGNMAYSAIGAAFGQMAEQLAIESTEWLERWRADVIDTLRGNTQLLIDVIPELGPLLGPQPAVSELPPAEAGNRFQLVFVDFIRSLVRMDRTLVLFLDDLQWCDGPTFALLKQLVTSRDLHHLLVIGAYRRGEVDGGHPISLALTDLHSVVSITEIELRKLDTEAIVELVAETTHRGISDARLLAKMVEEMAQGNAFFTVQLLYALHDNGSIRFDPAGGWTWDLERVDRAGVSADIAEFMIASLRRLPQDAQRVLQLAACIGNTFDLDTLSNIAGPAAHVVAESLMEAMRRKLVVPLDDDYRLVGSMGDADSAAVGQEDNSFNPVYGFRHDRVQMAAYELLAEQDRQLVHRSIGMQIYRASPRLDDARLLTVVEHLNRARGLISDGAEQRELARLNLRAGRLAIGSSAYHAALAYTEIGLELLGQDPWTDDFELAMSLKQGFQECTYLTGRHDDADRVMDEMLAHSRTPLETAELLAVRTRQFSTLGRMTDSIQAAVAGLGLLGIDFPINPTSQDVDLEVALVEQNLAGRAVEDLINATTLDNPAEAVAIRLLMEIFPAAFLSGSGDLFPFLVLKSVNLSLRHGNGPETAFSFAAYGMLLCGALGQPRLGHEYGQLAVKMNERFDNVALKSRVIYLYTMFIHHWNEHWSTMTPWFREGIEAGYRSGDLLYLAYSAQDCIIWDPRLDLDTAAQQHREFLEIVRDCDYTDSFDSGSLFLQMQLCLLGLTDDLCSLSDDDFDEDAVLKGMVERGFMTGVANYHIYKTEVAYFHGDMGEALRHVRLQDELMSSVMSLPQMVRFRLVSFLTLTATFSTMDDDERTLTMQRFERDCIEMATWAENCPENFAHVLCLMKGARGMALGDVDTAVRAFDQASTLAEENGFLRDEGLANELAARCQIAAGRTKAAVGYLDVAVHRYERWAARRKVELMHAEFGGLLSGRVASDVASLVRTASGSIDSSALDLEAVLRASQAISGELVVEDLWATTLPVLLTAAGAQRGCLVVRRDGDVTIEAEALAPGVERIEHVERLTEINQLAAPMSLVNRVLRTGEAMVINRPSELGPLERDRYFAGAPPQSLICVPMLRHGQFEGAIYLEHHDATDVFTDARVEVLRLLASQALISLENADLYQEQRRLAEAHRRFVPQQFLESLNRHDIALVGLGDHVSKEMSVLFADLRGFTSISERLDPKDVVQLLNRYFVSVEPAISDAGGFIDSFTGDEVMALFDGDPGRAIRAGVGMCHALDEFNAAQRADGAIELNMGIGVNTGPLVLGTVGVRDRIQCSVVGDTVNVASRIEQLTKSYGARLLVGERSLEATRTREEFSTRLVDRVAVKGKSSEIDVYEVLDAERPDRRVAKESTRDALEMAIELLRSGDARSALDTAMQASRQDRSDVVLRIHAERAAKALHQDG